MNVPKLRFKEFDGEWEVVSFKNIFMERNEKTGDFKNYPLYSLTVENGITAKSNRYKRDFLVKKENNFKKVYPNDFVSNPMNMTIGALGLSRESQIISVSGYYNVFYNNSDYDTQFLMDYLKLDKMIWKYKSIATGSLIEKQRVHYSQFIELKEMLPSYEEAKKIGAFFKSLDKKIQLQQQKIDLLQEQKNGYMQKIFGQELRFTDNDGKAYSKWKSIKLGALTNKTGKKNKDGFKYPVASVNNKTGCRIDGEKNNSNADVDISAYKIVCKDEFVYNPSRINVGSYGYQNLVEKAIVSSLYVVFETKEELLNEYLKIYMDTVYFNNEVKRNTEGSVREYLFYENFSNIKIPLPSLEEQKKIADFLGRLDNKINLEEAKLKTLQNQKQGFMQQMFI